MALRLDVSACSAIADSGRRSPSNRPTSSAVRCCASAALPPFPAASSRFPASSRCPRSSPQRARVGRGGLQRREGSVEPVDVRGQQRGELVGAAGRVRSARGAGPGASRVDQPRLRQPRRPSPGAAARRGRAAPRGARRRGHRATPSTAESSSPEVVPLAGRSSTRSGAGLPARSASTSSYTASVQSAMRSQP